MDRKCTASPRTSKPRGLAPRHYALGARAAESYLRPKKSDMGTSMIPVSIILLATVSGVAAQLRPAFQWTWGPGAPSTPSFEECQTLPISLIGVGQPPYYMLAFESGGISTSSQIGYDPANLWWQVNHKQGSSLVLAIVDSNHSTGGVPQNVFTVTAGNDTSCLQSIPSSTAVLHANVSDTMSTCDPLGLTVTGGQKPYTIVLAETHSDTVTFVSLADDDDTLTYISRVDPAWKVIASVYDASGHWGTSSNIIQASGSANTTCTGLWSTQSSSTDDRGGEPLSSSFYPMPSGTSVSAPATTTITSVTSSNNNSKNIHIAIGVSVGLGAPALIAVACVLVLLQFRRWKQSRSGTRPLSSPLSPIDQTDTSMLQPTPFPRPSSPGASRRGPTPRGVGTDGNNAKSSGSSPPNNPHSLTSAESPLPSTLRAPPSAPMSERTGLRLANPDLRPLSSSMLSTAESPYGSPGQISSQPSTASTSDGRMVGASESQEVLVRPDSIAPEIGSPPPPYGDSPRPPAAVLPRTSSA
ncbi:hypothetical protein PsYK624_126200 [Phanerochaete sordida]|uniref:Mid2 domain-containing protein n=1 Tax=Phanerochaete sordida TaxID=48140 RepID=A0A9P3GI86_9APHY|nr:hypothetical protein PsYK624_126200 [Phanerochaete sordida]